MSASKNDQPTDVIDLSQLSQEEQGKYLVEKFAKPVNETSFGNDLVKGLYRALTTPNSVPPLMVASKIEDQDIGQEELKAYLSSIRNLVKLIHAHGTGIDVVHYSYRVCHLTAIERLKNVLIRLQLPFALKRFKEALNRDPDNAGWDYLQYKDGKYYIGADELQFGDRVDAFHPDGVTFHHLEFIGHSALGAPKDIEQVPLVAYSLDNYDMPGWVLDTRNERGVAGHQRLLDADTFSALNFIFYRKSIKDKEPRSYQTKLFNDADFHPLIEYPQYISVDNYLVQLDTFFSPAVAKNKNVFATSTPERWNRYYNNLKQLCDKSDKVKRKIKKSKKLDGVTLIAFSELVPVLQSDRSKIVFFDAVTFDGEVVKLASVLYFQYDTSFGFLSRINLHVPKLVTAKIGKKDIKLGDELLDPNDFIFINGKSLDVYYFDPDTKPEKDMYLRAYLSISRMRA